MILSALRHADDHITAAQVLDQVRDSYSFIDLSTVYRTLDLLKQRRLISETHLGGDQHSYEWIGQMRHHHLVCQQCDSVADVDHTMLETLSSEILKQHGFKVDVYHLAFFGLCEECHPIGKQAPSSENSPNAN